MICSLKYRLRGLVTAMTAPDLAPADTLGIVADDDSRESLASAGDFVVCENDQDEFIDDKFWRLVSSSTQSTAELLTDIGDLAPGNGCSGASAPAAVCEEERLYEVAAEWLEASAKNPENARKVKQ